jgi:hypothetical protein
MTQSGPGPPVSKGDQGVSCTSATTGPLGLKNLAALFFEMPNITYSVKDSGGPEAVAGIRAVQKELAQLLRDIVSEAVKEGEAVARAEAPRAPNDRNAGHRISDSIRVSGSSYRAGGSGGGGSYEAELVADAAIAPQLQYVWNGTGAEGNIKPTHGNVLVFEGYDGQTHFARSVRGQKPQTEWWGRATRTMENYIEARIRSAGIGEPVRK